MTVSVKQLRDLEAQATAGPWRTGRKLGRTLYQRFPKSNLDDDVLLGMLDEDVDAALIVAMRNALPMLLDAVEAAQLTQRRWREMDSPTRVEADQMLAAALAALESAEPTTLPEGNLEGETEA